VQGAQFWQTNQVDTVAILQDPNNNNNLKVWTPKVEYRLDVNPVTAGRTTEIKAQDNVHTALIQGPQTKKGSQPKVVFAEQEVVKNLGLRPYTYNAQRQVMFDTAWSKILPPQKNAPHKASDPEWIRAQRSCLFYAQGLTAESRERLAA
jgi:hypothetical protein